MKARSAIQLLMFVWVCLGTCFAHHVAVIVNKGNGVENVTSGQLSGIVRGEVKKWPDGGNITLVLHKEWAGETATLEHLNKMTIAEWKSFLALRKSSIVFVETDADVIKAVQADPGAVGLIEVPSIDNSIHVVRVNGKLPMEFGYLPH
jgi:ABC-type phosphate transport system substrate-binding protein